MATAQTKPGYQQPLSGQSRQASTYVQTEQSTRSLSEDVRINISDSPQNNQLSFEELLFTPALVPYFKSVFKTNRDGFNSSTPNSGLWELYVYEQSNFRSGAKRMIRDKFITAVKALGQHLKRVDAHGVSADNNLDAKILQHIASDKSRKFFQNSFW